MIFGLFKANTCAVISTKVFKVDNGFGYIITLREKVLIKQNTIPAIQKKIAFCSENDAISVANLVKSKIENNLIPTVSLQELNNLNIEIHCSE